MAPRLLLHIGSEKTGTTAWQAWLQQQRDVLDRQGFAVPTTLGPTNHRRLPTSCFDLDRLDDLVIRSGLQEASPALRQQTYQDWQGAFAAEVKTRPTHSWLVSSEHCSSRLTRFSELGRLQTFLEPLFSRIEILLVIREPLQAAISAWSTLVRNGGYPLEQLPPPDHPLLADICDHRALVQRWSTRFAHLTLCTYETDVVAMLVQASGIPIRSGISKTPARHNRSLSHQAIIEIARLNRSMPVYVGSQLNPERETRIAQIVETYRGEPAFVPSLKQQDDFKVHFADSTSWIHQTFFPDRLMLFS